MRPKKLLSRHPKPNSSSSCSEDIGRGYALLCRDWPRIEDYVKVSHGFESQRDTSVFTTCGFSSGLCNKSLVHAGKLPQPSL